MIIKPSLSECGIQESGEMFTTFRDYLFDKMCTTRNPLKSCAYAGILKTIHRFLVERVSATQAQAQAFTKGVLSDHT